MIETHEGILRINPMWWVHSHYDYSIKMVGKFYCDFAGGIVQDKGLQSLLKDNYYKCIHTNRHASFAKE